MTSLWARNNATLGTEADPDLAPDIKRLRGIVNKFESPYVEISYHQRVATVRKKWPLYASDLSDLSDADTHPGSDQSALNNPTVEETS